VAFPAFINNAPASESLGSGGAPTVVTLCRRCGLFARNALEVIINILRAPHFGRYTALLGLVSLAFGPCAQARPVHRAAAVRPAPVSAPAPTTPPKLLVAIAVDQFSADLFAQYRQHFTSGFARLMQGAVFPSAFQSHAATETCPGHSTMLTGVHPARSGIIANNWYDFSAPRDDKHVYCAEDEHDPNSTVKEPVVSAGHLKVPTLGERMKVAWPTSRNVAVSAKDRAVMMMGGHKIDAAYWFTGRGFSSYNGTALVPEAIEENTRVLALVGKGAPALVGGDWCRARDRDVAAQTVTVGSGRFAQAADDFDGFRASPRIDAATLDLAARLVADMKLGKGPSPDMLSVSLSATDYIGHAYGTEGEEMCVQMGELDRSLGAFFAKLDAMGIDYAVMLTADHGGLDVPERLAQQGLPTATRADRALTSDCLNEAIATRFKLSGYMPAVSACNPPPGVSPSIAGPQAIYADSAFGDYWVNTALPEDTRKKVIAALAEMLRASPQVEAVYTKADLDKVMVPHGNPQDWTLIERAAASYDPQRTGDVFSVLHRAVVPIPYARAGITATHGSPWDYDRRVPLLFWRRGVPGLEQPAPVETVDIAPTFAALIGLAVPAGSFDGRCLDIDGGPGDTCASLK
jgi:predicted AlkP superfamily pyrophosphatase or phosphodiesterase